MSELSPTNCIQTLRRQAHSYTEVYTRVTRVVEPNRIDRLLMWMNLEDRARDRRLRRIKAQSQELETIAQRAESVLLQMTTLARGTLDGVRRSNEIAIGRIVRGEAIVNIKRRELEFFLEECKETILYLRKAGLVLSDDDRSIWTTIDVSRFLGPEIIDSAVHQQRWLRLVRAIVEDEAANNELVAARHSFAISSSHERVLGNILVKCNSELQITQLRAQDLKSSVVVGDVDTIENFIADQRRGYSITNLEMFFLESSA